MEPLINTAFYAGLLALIYVYLSIGVIKLRIKHRVGIGDGGEEVLGKAIRVHGNFAEYVPLAIVLLAIFEIRGGGAMWVHLVGILLVVSRLLHVIGLSKSIGTSAQRKSGMLITFGILIALSCTFIFQFIASQFL